MSNNGKFTQDITELVVVQELWNKKYNLLHLPINERSEVSYCVPPAVTFIRNGKGVSKGCPLLNKINSGDIWPRNSV